jgi:ATP synthase protein I
MVHDEGLEGKRQERWKQLSEQIGTKEAKKLQARREKERGIWFGLGMFGMVGWSVAIPTVIGIALGIWIDAKWPSRFSWTLMLLIIGMMLGCLNAWFWVTRERRMIKGDKGQQKDG